MSKRWTQEEDKKLKELFPKSSKQELLTHFPNRTYNSIERRAERINLSRENNVKIIPWTPEEDALLKELYPKLDNQELLPHFPNRNLTAIQGRVRKKRIRKNNTLEIKPWTQEEDKKLKELFPKLPKQELLTHFPNRTYNSIERRAGKFNIKKENNIRKSWTQQEITLLKEIYENNLKNFILEKLPNRTWKGILEKAISLKLFRRKDLILQDNVGNTKKAIKEKYGVNYSWQVDEVKEKIKKTNLKNLGVEYPMQSQEIKEKSVKTSLEKWGTSSPMKNNMVKNSLKETFLEKYGVSNPLKHSSVRKKLEDTNLVKYGYKNPFQNEEIKEKIKNTNLKNLGVENPQQNKDIQIKTQMTNLKRYGGTAPISDKNVKEKIVNTNIDKYGFETPLLNEEVKEKIKNTNLEKYGVVNVAQNEEVLKKIQETNLKKYGATSVLAIEKYRNREKAFQTMKERNSFIRSKPEEEFLVDLRKYVDPAIIHHKKHPILKYIIDYYSPKYDMWIQFDGFYWHGRYTTKEVLEKNPKFNCVGSNVQGVYKNMVNDEIQNKNIPNLIRFWEDDIKKHKKKDTLFNLIKEKFLKKGIKL